MHYNKYVDHTNALYELFHERILKDLHSEQNRIAMLNAFKKQMGEQGLRVDVIASGVQSLMDLLSVQHPIFSMLAINCEM